MKRKKYIIICIITVSLLITAYKIYIKTVDTRYAVRFSEVFMNYNINEIDELLSDETQIIYKNKKSSYKELKTNTKKACEKKSYEFYNGSSYGYGNDKFINNLQVINIKLYGCIYGENFGECNINMTLKKTSPFSFCVDSISCNEDVFGVLFFDE